MRKDTQAVLLLLIGGTLLKISFAGTYVRYVKPGLLPLLLIAAVVLITVAGVTLWQVIRSGPAPGGATRAGGAHTASAQNEAYSGTHAGTYSGAHTAIAMGAAESADQIAEVKAEPATDESGYGDGHGHGEPRVGWLLLAPALALLLFAPPALGSYQASRNGTALATQQDSDFPPLAQGDPVRISMLDYAGRAVFDQGRSLAGRRVTLSGFVIAGPHGEPYLARMIVSCCAADARPVKVGLTGDIPADLKPDEWIEIEGTYIDKADRDPVNGDLVPYIQVVSVHDIAAPELQYES